MATKTIKLTGAEIAVTGLDGAHAHIRNDSAAVIYAAKTPGITAGADGVLSIPAGASATVYSIPGTVYLLGNGAATVVSSDYTDSPFKPVSTSGGADVIPNAAEVVTLDGLQGGVPFSEISITSKNILPYPFVSKTKTEKGISFTNNNDGSITADGTATDMVYSYMAIPLLLPSGTYTISDGAGAVSSDFYIQVYLYNAPYTTLATTTANHAFTLAEATEVVFRLVAVKGAVLSGITVKPQLERGDTATDYEPPAGQEIMLIVNGAEYALTPDSNPYIVPNDIRQQDGANNVTVSAGTVQVTGVKRNAAVKRIWDKLDELTAAIIVSNGEI